MPQAKTFWVSASSHPSTSLELLAKAIFDFHAKTLRQQDPPGTPHGTSRADGAESGAEWWVQRREEGHHANLGMPFHWDKDENKLEQEGVVLCPAVSTVTYLTDHGAPTVVLEVRLASTRLLVLMCFVYPSSGSVVLDGPREERVAVNHFCGSSCVGLHHETSSRYEDVEGGYSPLGLQIAWCCAVPTSLCQRRGFMAGAQGCTV